MMAWIRFMKWEDEGRWVVEDLNGDCCGHFQHLSGGSEEIHGTGIVRRGGNLFCFKPSTF